MIPEEREIESQSSDIQNRLMDYLRQEFNPNNFKSQETCVPAERRLLLKAEDICMNDGFNISKDKLIEIVKSAISNYIDTPDNRRFNGGNRLGKMTMEK